MRGELQHGARNVAREGRQVFEGVGGYERVRRPLSLSVPDASAFRAEHRRLVVEGIELGDYRVTPLVGAGPVPDGADTLRIIAVASGVLRYWTGERVFEGRAGSVHLLPPNGETRFAIPEPTRLLRVSLPRDLVSPLSRDLIPTAAGPLRPSRLANGFVALVEQVLESPSDRQVSPAARAIRSLATAVLEESMPERQDLDLREQILEHIERHLGDQDLGPRRIAEHFDISLRWVHRVFNADGVSLARHIRERRTDMVAARLRADHRWVRIGALAAQYGFAGRDQLTRAFKARYGMTVAAYADVLADGGPLPAPRPLAEAASAVDAGSQEDSAAPA